jgi:pyruvate dehydrogenase E1 component beta subunit
VYSGLLRATEVLLARFGDRRVLDAPLAKAGLAGLAIGLAAQRLRPA